MQPKKVQHVDAVFGGRTIRFELGRDLHSLLALENDLGSIHGSFRRFLDGTWLVSDVLTILSRSHPSPRQANAETWPTPRHTVGSVQEASDRMREAAGLPRRFPVHRAETAPRATRGINPALLGSIIGSAPPTVYAILAVRILEALLYGVEPARARWDERNPTDEEEQPTGAAA